VYKHKTYGSSFQAKRAQGERFEKKVVKALQRMGAEAWIAPEHKFDIRFNVMAPIMGTIAYTCECKFDDMAYSTGNLALQTFDGGKPSGIHPDGPRPDLWAMAWRIKLGLFAHQSFGPLSKCTRNLGAGASYLWGTRGRTPRAY